MHVTNEPGTDPLAETAKDIEAFAEGVIEFAGRAVDEGTIAPAFLPEALLLAAVELAARHGGGAEHVADWRSRVAERLSGHVEPDNGSIQ